MPRKRPAHSDIHLPAQPTGKLVDVNPDNTSETGVQIFAAEYLPNLTGSPYAVGDDVERGWPSYLTSAKTDSENEDEVIGGKLVIWAPDGEQSFPSEFGADGKLFTQDDPVMPVPQGYSVIDLDQKPFAILRDAEPELVLYEPNDVAIKDFSSQSYTEAFDNMFQIVRKEYAFQPASKASSPTGIRCMPDLAPRVKEAEQKKDSMAYYLAMHDFTLAFKDGHVGLSGGDMENQFFSEQTAGGYGFAIRELDGGRVIVVPTSSPVGLPRLAGMKKGAEVTEFNGKPISEAIAAIKPLSAPHSTDFSRRYQPGALPAPRAEGTKASVTFTNPQPRQRRRRSSWKPWPSARAFPIPRPSAALIRMRFRWN